MNNPAIPDVISPAAYIPPAAIAFGRIGEDANFVSHGNPLPVRPGSADLSLIERLNREGEPYSNYQEGTLATFTPNPPSGSGINTVLGLAAPPSIGRANFFQTVVLSCTTPIAGRYQLGGSQVTGAGTSYPAGFSLYLRPQLQRNPADQYLHPII